MLENILKQISNELPWVEKTRLILGSRISRELVKDMFLGMPGYSAVPGYSIVTLSDFINELFLLNNIEIPKPISEDSKADIIQFLAKKEIIQSRLPHLSQHLAKREIAKKISKFISGIDKVFTHQEELDALIERINLSKPESAEFMKIISELWKREELSPWTEAFHYRKCIEQLETSHFKTAEIHELHLFGFDVFTLIETELILKLSKKFKIFIYIPENLSNYYQNYFSNSDLQFIYLKSKQTEAEFWHAHSPLDEIEFLIEDIFKQTKNGIKFSELAIHVPQNEVFKRILKEKLMSHHIPIYDPTLADEWKEYPEWLWWRDFFKVLTNGLKRNEIIPLLQNKSDHNLIKALVSRADRDGPKLIKKINTENKSSILSMLLECFIIFSKSMSAEEYLNKITELKDNLQLNTKMNSEVLVAFANHMANEREYLSHAKFRLSKFMSYFEEFLQKHSKQNSLRCRDGLHLAGHDVLLPFELKKRYFLSLNEVNLAKINYDRWDWESLEAEYLWKNLNSFHDLKTRNQIDEEFFKFSISESKINVFSSVDYDLAGKPAKANTAFNLITTEAQPVFTKQGAHPSLQWIKNEESLKNGTTNNFSIPKITYDELSFSKFETYLQCPFVFYTKNILNIDKDYEPGLMLSPVFQGNLIHKVIESVLKNEIKKEVQFDSEPKIKENVFILFDKIWNEMFLSKKEATGLMPDQALIENAKFDMKEKLLGWLKWEFSYRKAHPNIRTISVEESLDFHIVIGPQQTLRLKGKVDRIDSDGESFSIIDYKTGFSLPTRKNILEGHAVQLLGYAQSASLKYNLKPGACYYLKIGRVTEYGIGLYEKSLNKILFTRHAQSLSKEKIPEILDSVLPIWELKSKELKNNNFAPNPARPKECSKCDSRFICGYQFSEDVEGAQE